jgi:hypothetical protein
VKRRTGESRYPTTGIAKSAAAQALSAKPSLKRKRRLDIPTGEGVFDCALIIVLLPYGCCG